MSYKLLVLEGITERGLQLLKAEGWQIDQHKAMTVPPIEALVNSAMPCAAPAASVINLASSSRKRLLL